MHGVLMCFKDFKIHCKERRSANMHCMCLIVDNHCKCNHSNCPGVYVFLLDDGGGANITKGSNVKLF